MELCTFSKANPVNLSCFIVEHRQVLILRRVLKDFSASHDVTGKTKVWINIFLMLGDTKELAHCKEDCDVSGSSFSLKYSMHAKAEAWFSL